MRLVWTALILLVLVAAGFWGYQQYQLHNQAATGQVTWLNGQPSPAEKAAFDYKNSGGDETARADARAQAAPVSATSQTSAVPAANPAPSNSYTATAAPLTQPPADLPRADSMPRNAPNGVRFGGTGAFELYRQGNLTYRIDTTTGQTCVAFATLAEWRKPLVMKNGCGSRS